MKKTMIVVALASLVVSVNAQTEKLVGSWLMTKVEVGEEIHEPYFITNFKENGKVEVMEMEVGMWKLNDNVLSLESEFDKDFNGESKILSLDEKNLIVVKDGAKLFYSKINQAEINAENKKSKLIGTWNVENSDGSVVVMKFTEPNEFLLINSDGGVKETSRGEWIYNDDENSLIVLSLSNIVKGMNKILKISDTELEMENTGSLIKAKKEEEKENSIERLSFEYEDFPEEVSEEYYLPWSGIEGLVYSLEQVEFLKYKYGKLLEEVNSFEYSTILSKIKVNVEKESVEFTNLYITENDTSQFSQNYKGGLSEMYNDFFPKEELDPYKILGVKSVTVPAGTFECTVVIGFDGEDKVKYWMINDSPGVYAKIIKEGLSVFDDLEYTIMELEEIK